MKEHIGFRKWLYERTKRSIKEVLIMLSLIGGFALATFSFSFGIVRTPFALIGIPIGILLFFYGIYQININAPSSD